MIHRFLKTSKILPSVLIVVLLFSFANVASAQNQPSNELNTSNISECITQRMVPVLVASVARAAGFTTATAAGAAAGAGPSVDAAVVSVPTVDVVSNTISGEIQAYDQAVGSFSNIEKMDLDALAYTLGQCTLDELTNNTVAWIKGGFKGRPNYAINTQQLFQGMAYGAMEDFAGQLRNIQACDFSNYFRNDLADAVELSTPRRSTIKRQIACPFSTTGPSVQQMYNEFSVMGWRGLSTALSDSGSAFAVKANTALEAQRRLAENQKNIDQKLSWSNGFADIIDKDSCNFPEDVQEIIDTANDIGSTKNEYYTTQYCNTTTPGKMVEEKLHEVLGLDSSRLGLADNMNKIISALIGQLTKEAMNGIFKYALDPTQQEITEADRKLDEQLQGAIDIISESSSEVAGAAVRDASSQPRVKLTTNFATETSTSSATLNASVDTAGIVFGNLIINFWYGTDINDLSSLAQTGSFRVTAGFSFGANKPITGLLPNTKYYYQASGEMSDSISSETIIDAGNIMTFTTEAL